ncbi:MAG: S-layer homology domain-containing protein [Clostridia bacterium]|nr:S-layer homology domain-containing protein [Clostridia bacterium]
MRFGKKLMSLLLALSLVIGQAAFAQAAYQDIDGHWAKSEIESWSSKGILEGSNGVFRPSDDITRAEMMVIINRIMKFEEKASNAYADLGQTWYTDAVLKNIEAGIIQGYEGKVRPEDKISREEAIVMLGRALDIQEMYGATSFADNGDIASWSLGYVKAFVEKGYVKGRPGNMIAPKATISRGEVVKLMDNVVSGLYAEKGTYSDDVVGNVVINTPNVTLSDMKIEGNLIIAEGVGDGEVYLDQVAITGDVIVKGGGENSIYFNSVTVGGGLVVKKSDGKIRIVASGSTSVKATTLKSGAILVEKELIGGGFETVVVPAEVVGDSKVVLTGNFTEFNAFSKDLVVELSNKTVVDKVVVASGAEGFNISGAGKAGTMKVEASNVSTSIKTDRIEVAKDAQQVLNNGKELAAGSTTSTASNTSNSSGSTSSSSSGKSSGSSSSGGSSSGGTTTVLASSIAFNYAGDKLTLSPEATYQLSATVSPTNATNKALFWGLLTTSGAGTTFIPNGSTTPVTVTTGAGTVSGPIISVDQTGKVIATNTTGAATVVAIAKDGSNTVAMLSVEVSETQDPTPPTPPTGTVTVTFDAGTYGSQVPAKVLNAGDKITSSTYTERYGYTFEGWLLNGNLFDVDETPITESIELVADWALDTEHFGTNPLLHRDDRFATGYPKMVVENEKWVLKVKLADASDRNPADVYMVFDRYMDETSVENVMHGHLGIDDASIELADYSLAVQITDTEEYVFNTDEAVSKHARNFGSAFVIDQGNVLDNLATVVISPAIITEELDTTAPKSYNAYLSIDKTIIAMDFNEEIDATKTLDPTDFTFVNGTAGMAVTKAYRYQYDETYVILEVSGFSDYQENSGLVFQYSGDDLMDLSGNVANNDSFEFLDLNYFVVPTVERVVLSTNGYNVMTRIIGTTLEFAGCTYYDGTTELDSNANMGTRWNEELKEYDRLDQVFPTANIANLHVRVDFDQTLTTLLGGTDIIADTTASLHKVAEQVSMVSATYDTSSSLLSIALNGNYNDYKTFGCSFLLTINGLDYVLNGTSNYFTHDGNVDGEYTNLDFDLSDMLFNIEAGDNVTIQYQEQHTVSDEYTDYLYDEASVSAGSMSAVPVFIQ